MELGVPPHVVQAIARHADVKLTLKVYSHANLDAMRQALGKLDGTVAATAWGVIFLRRFALLVSGGRGRFRTCDPSLVSSGRSVRARLRTSLTSGTGPSSSVTGPRHPARLLSPLLSIATGPWSLGPRRAVSLGSRLIYTVG